jgi:hypothetical protein
VEGNHVARRIEGKQAFEQIVAKRTIEDEAELAPSNPAEPAGDGRFAGEMEHQRRGSGQAHRGEPHGAVLVPDGGDPRFLGRPAAYLATSGNGYGPTRIVTRAASAA